MSDGVRFYLSIDDALNAELERIAVWSGEPKSTVARLALRAGAQHLRQSMVHGTVLGGGEQQQNDAARASWRGTSLEEFVASINSAQDGLALLELAGYAVDEARGFPPMQQREWLRTVQGAVEQWGRRFSQE